LTVSTCRSIKEDKVIFHSINVEFLVPRINRLECKELSTLKNYILLEGFGANDGRVEDTHYCRAELYINISTFSILDIIRRVYGFTPT
jgi:hypothetical protein